MNINQFMVAMVFGFSALEACIDAAEAGVSWWGAISFVAAVSFVLFGVEIWRKLAA